MTPNAAELFPLPVPVLTRRRDGWGTGVKLRLVRSLLVIGIGVGNPDQLTFEAARAIGTADVFFFVDKHVAADLLEVRTEILGRHARPDHRVVVIEDPPRDRDPADYRAAVADWHAARADRFAAAIADELADDQTGAFLVWGDPSLYDSTLRVIDAIHEAGTVAFDHRVVPGITSPQALAAAHRVCLHEVGEPFTVTTGRRLGEAGGPGATSTVVMLDGADAFASIDPDGIHITWGAYLGTDDEILVSGPLAEVADQIVATRRAARAAHGWIMDTYLLRPTRT